MKKKVLSIILAGFMICQSITAYGAEFTDSTEIEYEQNEETNMEDDIVQDYEESDDFTDGQPNAEQESDVAIFEDTETDDVNSEILIDDNDEDAYNATADELTSGNYKYVVSENEASITRYTGTESYVKIPEKINGYIVKTIGRNAFKNYMKLEKIEIPDSVTEIGEGAFYYCISLKEVVGGKNLQKLGGEAFASCKNLEKITLPSTLTQIGYLIFSGCEKVTIYGYDGSAAQTYAQKNNIPFVILKEDSSTSNISVQDYDYSHKLNEWLRDEGTANSMAYLSKNENFVNSMMVANYDSSFLDEFIENSSSLIYGGFEGWNDYWQDSTKTEQAREILVALLNSYRNQVEDLSMLETADKFANIYISTLKNGNWAYATIYGLNNSEIKELSKLCTTENLTEYFLNGKYGSITKYLQEAGGYSENSKIIKCIKKFSNSSEYAKALEESYKQMGMAIKVVSLTESTINRYHNLTALFKADERYCEMLAYLKDSCSYGPIKQAASDLYDIIKGDCVKQLEYLSKNIVDELETKAVEKILDAATDNVSLVSITYKAYKYSRDIANIVFNTNDAQKQKDNMRCAAYIGAYLSRWMQYNKSMYAKSSGEDKKQYAKQTVFAYYMLLKTRIAGEKSGRKYMDAIRFKSGSRQYKVSLQITSTLESMEELLKQKNVLGNKYASSTVSCPVDVDVCDSSGKTILTVYDGKESSGNVNGIYYNVYYHDLDQDYVKIINFPENSGYTLRCKANDIGKVDYIVSTISGNGTSVRKETNEISIQKGNQVEITNISQDQPTCKLIDNNGAVKQEYVAQPENDKDIPVTGLKADSEVLNIQIGKKVLANVKITPENATIKTVLWSSSDEAVARVNADGVIEGVSAGNAIIKVVSAKNDKVYTEIKVTVSANGNVPITPGPTTSPAKKPSTPKLSKITVTYNAITVNWNAVSDADGYQIYRKTNSGKWETVKNTAARSYKDKNVKAGYKYSYTVKAYKKINGKKVYSGYNKKGLSGKLNTSISLAVKNKTVSVSWKKTTGANGYYIYRSTKKNGKFGKIKTITNAKTLKYTDKKVKEGTTYYYKVIPFRTINSKKTSGSSSKIKNIKVAKKQQNTGYNFIPGINKIIPLLEKADANNEYYEKICRSTDYKISVSFQFFKKEKGQSYFTIVCQADTTKKENYIVLNWNEGEEEPWLNVLYVKDSDCKVMGDLFYQSKGNDYVIDFDRNSTLDFAFNATSESDKYTLKQLNTMGNEKFHEALRIIHSCLKSKMNMSIEDLGFKDYITKN